MKERAYQIIEHLRSTGNNIEQNGAFSVQNKKSPARSVVLGIFVINVLMFSRLNQPWSGITILYLLLFRIHSPKKEVRLRDAVRIRHPRGFHIPVTWLYSGLTSMSTALTAILQSYSPLDSL